MGLLFDSFWRAAAYCLRPRVIALSLLPLVLMAVLAMGLGYLYWDAAVQLMRTLLDASSLLASVWGWLQGWGLGDVTAVMAPLMVVLAVAPVLVVVSLLAVAEDGSLVRVVAAPQAVLRITPCPQHGTPFDLVRAAYHLGNRHVPIELTPAYLQIEPDHVLADMLRAMHLAVQEQQAAFEPESGAYGDHAASHGHGHSHPHAHGHDHGPGPHGHG